MTSTGACVASHAPTRSAGAVYLVVPYTRLTTYRYSATLCVRDMPPSRYTGVPTMYETERDTIETFDAPGAYEDLGPIGRRRAAREDAERRAIGRPAVYAPIPLSPFTRRAMARQLPAAEIVR